MYNIIIMMGQLISIDVDYGLDIWYLMFDSFNSINGGSLKCWNLMGKMFIIGHFDHHI